MQVDKMSVAIRPMSTSQAIDLGFMMARHWYLPLWKIWFRMAFPLFLIMTIGWVLIGNFVDESFLAYESDANLFYFFLFIFILWWFKPMFEKPMVKWLGSALFSEFKSVNTILKENKGGYVSQFGRFMFRFRLSSSRNVILPFVLLEMPSSQSFFSRLNLLLRGQSGGLFWFSFMMFVCEVVFTVGIIVFFLMTLSGQLMGIPLIESLAIFPLFGDVLLIFIYFMSISVIAPFFVAGGFAVYLTKRCLLEGWDIELVFKQLGNRYQASQQNPMSALISQSNHSKTSYNQASISAPANIQDSLGNKPQNTQSNNVVSNHNDNKENAL